MGKAVELQPSQTILDVCVQEHGTLESLFQMHQDNGLGEFPALLLPGQVVMIDSDYSSPDPSAVKFLQSNKPATGKSVVAYTRPGGIGYMQIGVDFKVS
jgi:hypothetical protein